MIWRNIICFLFGHKEDRCKSTGGYIDARYEVGRVRVDICKRCGAIYIPLVRYY